jgi:hypothetical protein
MATPLLFLARPPPWREEAPPWEQLSPDTDDLTARADTAPRTAPKNPSSRKRLNKSTTVVLDLAKRVQLLIIMGVIGFFIVVGVVAAVVISLFGGANPKSTDKVKPAGNVLLVTKDGSLRTIGEALKKAQPGDTIKVRDAVQECISLEGKRHPNLTIEAEDPAHYLAWSFPANPPTGTTHLIDVRYIEGLTVRGFILDGGDKVNQVIMLHGNCPGLKLENLKIKGFKEAGVLVTNCAGTSERPVTLSRLTFIADGQPKDAGVLFKYAPNIKDPPRNQHINVHKCTIELTIKAPVSVPEKDANDATVFLDP